MAFFKGVRIIVAGVIIGAFGGYLYWRFIGCTSGTCPITSSALNSSLYGAVIGGLFFNMFNFKNNNL